MPRLHSLHPLLFAALAAGCLGATVPARAATGLEACETQFPGATAANAPAYAAGQEGAGQEGAGQEGAGHEDAGRPLHLCKTFKGEAFFALAYNARRKAAEWVAYRLSVEDLGPAACRTLSRRDWRGFFFGGAGHDSYFADSDLAAEGDSAPLEDGAYRGTGFDRGHQAPAAAFAWNACGWYRSFTMANISPQRPSLNRESWRDLENAVRFWAVELGSLYVVTGPFYPRFPQDRFAPFAAGGPGHAEAIQAPGQWIGPTGDRTESRGGPDGQRGPEGASIPTGSYKAIYAPAAAGRPARAIAFLLPNTMEVLPWTAFALSTAELERLLGIRFGIPAALKDEGRIGTWPLPPENWVRRPCADGSLPAMPPELRSHPDLCLGK